MPKIVQNLKNRPALPAPEAGLGRGQGRLGHAEHGRQRRVGEQGVIGKMIQILMQMCTKRTHFLDFELNLLISCC